MSDNNEDIEITLDDENENIDVNEENYVYINIPESVIEEMQQEILLRSLITETGSQITLEIDNSTFVLVAKLKDKNGNVIYTSNGIDLPIESMIMNVTYDSETKELVITLQNGTVTRVSIADIVSGLVNEDDFTEFEETVNAELEELKERDAKIISQIPTSTASGISIDLDDSSDLEFEKFEVEGRSTQITYNGENLFDKNTMGRINRYINNFHDKWQTSADSYSVAIPCEPNRSYTISHSVTTATIFRCAYIKVATIPGSGEVACYNIYRGTTDTSYTITTGADATFIIFQANASAMSDIVNSLEVVGNFTEPSVDYPETIHSAGNNEALTEKIVNVNFFDGVFTRGTISGSSNIRLRSTNQIDIIPNEDFTISLNSTITSGTIQVMVYAYDNNNDRIQITDDWHNTPYTFKVSGAAKKIRFVLRKSDDSTFLVEEVYNVQVQKGSSVLPYQAHLEQNITIPCQQPMRSVNTVKDEFVKVSGTWYERHNIAYIASYDGETITTDYMSTTGGLDTGASVQYVASTPTDIQCTEAQIAVLESLKDVTSYRNITHIYSNDTTPAYVDTVYRKDLTTMFNKLDTLEARVALLED